MRVDEETLAIKVKQKNNWKYFETELVRDGRLDSIIVNDIYINMKLTPRGHKNQNKEQTYSQEVQLLL